MLFSEVVSYIRKLWLDIVIQVHLRRNQVNLWMMFQLLVRRICKITWKLYITGSFIRLVRYHFVFLCQYLSIVLICSRTFMSIIGGVIAGILGFTGLMGFILYFLVMAITSIGLIAKAKFSVHSYFDSWNRIIFDGFMGGLMVNFFMFWVELHFPCYIFCEKSKFSALLWLFFT